MEVSVGGKLSKAERKHAGRKPLVFGEIEELRRKGYNEAEIADMYGVTRQAVNWHKHTYGGHLTTRQIVRKAWPWKTNNEHSRNSAYQRLRDHGEYMREGSFKSMTFDKKHRLRRWWKYLRDNDLVLEFAPQHRTVRRDEGWRFPLRPDSGWRRGPVDPRQRAHGSDRRR